MPTDPRELTVEQYQAAFLKLSRSLRPGSASCDRPTMARRATKRRIRTLHGQSVGSVTLP
jgi:hypothetical protein